MCLLIFIILIFFVITLIMYMNKKKEYYNNDNDNNTSLKSNDIFDSYYFKFMKELPNDIFTFLYSKALIVPGQLVKKLPIPNKEYIGVY